MPSRDIPPVELLPSSVEPWHLNIKPSHRCQAWEPQDGSLQIPIGLGSEGCQVSCHDTGNWMRLVVCFAAPPHHPKASGLSIMPIIEGRGRITGSDPDSIRIPPNISLRMEVVMGVSWGCHGAVMGVSWGCHGDVMGVSWGCHGGVMGVSCAQTL